MYKFKFYEKIIMLCFIIIIGIGLWYIMHVGEYFETNLFNAKLPNIFASNFYSNNQPMNIPTPTKSIGEITFDSYIYSDIVSNQIICANYNNQGDCWDNNKCQWVYKIDGGSYCDLAPKWLL